MKKWTIVCLAVLLCSILSLTVAASESDSLPDGYFATSNDLFQYWNSTYPPQYPDYIGGVWTENGTAYPLTFALTDDEAGEAGKAELLRLLADDGSVMFTTVKYSYNTLCRIQDEIMPYFEREIGLVGMGIFDMENHVGVELHRDYRNHPETQAFVQQLMQQYGDAVQISYTDGYVAMTYDILDADANRGSAAVLFTAAGVCLLGAATLVWILYRRHHKHG